MLKIIGALLLGLLSLTGPIGTVVASVLPVAGVYFKRALRWFLIPVPFALGPLLILTVLAALFFMRGRGQQQRSAQYSDSLAIVRDHVRQLSADTATMHKQERTYHFKLDSTHAAFQTYRAYISGLSDAALQRELDSVYGDAR